MNRGIKLLLFVLLGVNFSCALEDADPAALDLESTSYDFNYGLQGWEHGFSEYPVDSADYNLQFSYGGVAELNGQGAVMLSGNNIHGDLFMYLKKRIRNLQPNSLYTLTFEIELASQARAGENDVDGYPGDEVFLKVGATDLEPKSLIDESYYTMNIDKGRGADNGNEMVNIGNIGVPGDSFGFVLINRSNVPYSGSNANYTSPVVVRSNNDGEIWLIVGTDSEYNGMTTVYYSRISVVLTKSD